MALESIITIPRYSKAKTAVAAFGPALVLAFAAAFPGLIFLYSGHGGIAWLLLPFALPLAVCVLLLGYRRAPLAERRARMRFAIASLTVYAPASLAASFIGAHSISAYFGLSVSPFEMWALFMSPFGLPFVW